MIENIDYTELELRIVSAMFRRARSQPAPSVVTGRMSPEYPGADGRWRRWRSSADFDQERATEAARDAEQWRCSRRAPRRRFGV